VSFEFSENSRTKLQTVLGAHYDRVAPRLAALVEDFQEAQARRKKAEQDPREYHAFEDRLDWLKGRNPEF
jgi:hypothetical protein